MRGFVITLSLLMVAALVLVVGGFVWWNNVNKSFSADNSEIDFLITKGSSAMEIGNKLYEKKLIKSPLAFKFYVQLTGKADRIQAGEFRLASNMDLFKVVKTLTSGPVELWITIPEGLRREQIAYRFADGLEKNGEERNNFIEDFLTESELLEGYLFPETYLFPKSASAEKIVGKLKETFILKAGDVDRENLIIASLIERETVSDEERPIVAGILFNRIKDGMPLQVDATVQYAVANSKCKSQNLKCEYWEPITREDYKFNSLYNTYRYSGVPPGPISNPGLLSIKAVQNPVQTDYHYYIHDDKGTVHYAKTLSEHNLNITRYLH